MKSYTAYLAGIRRPIMESETAKQTEQIALLAKAIKSIVEYS